MKIREISCKRRKTVEYDHLLAKNDNGVESPKWPLLILFPILYCVSSDSSICNSVSSSATTSTSLA
ncbi:hypothetical protein SLEP1_g5941 [Rubroshorea leprosula]|uniref:Uncharacterized protein n=1 Tax=Rubroshorea leprosula TaxID=152421 RepID=A0AAV5I1P0_9ROSI|nr:hypothetical protein SLEP1_g5941 [Rubroshorea leprosula]